MESNNVVAVKPGGVSDLPPDLPRDGTADYWHSLIDEGEAADFLGLQKGTIQNKRQAGDGPRFVRLSARCIRYRRIDLKAWADERLVSSTSDPGPKAAA